MKQAISPPKIFLAAMSSSRSDVVTQSVRLSVCPFVRSFVTFFLSLVSLKSVASNSVKGIYFESRCVSRVFQGSFKGVTRKFQGCFKEVPRIFRGSSKEVLMVF